MPCAPKMNVSKIHQDLSRPVAADLKMRASANALKPRHFHRSAGACPPRASRHAFFSMARSAGACPPRSLGYANDSPPSVVRERPLPNGSRAGALELQKETRHFHRSAGACPPRSLGYADDSRTSVVRERLLPNGSRAGALELQKRREGLVHERWRGTGPRPTVRGAFFVRQPGRFLFVNARTFFPQPKKP